MPDILASYEQLALEGVVLLVGNIGEDPADAENFGARNNVAFPVIVNRYQVVMEAGYPIYNLPTLMDGIMRHVFFTGVTPRRTPNSPPHQASSGA